MENYFSTLVYDQYNIKIFKESIVLKTILDFWKQKTYIQTSKRFLYDWLIYRILA